MRRALRHLAAGRNDPAPDVLPRGDPSQQVAKIATKNKKASKKKAQESTGQAKRGLEPQGADEAAVVVKKPRTESDLATQAQPVEEKCQDAEEKQVRRRRRKRSRGKGSRSNGSVDTPSSAELREKALNEAQRNTRLALPAQDYSKWPKLKGPPSVGNCIAFKVRVGTITWPSSWI